MDARQQASGVTAASMIHPSALIDPTAKVGKGTRIWAFVQVAEHAVIGKNCVIGNGTYIDRRVRIGNDVRIHNKALLYHGVILENKVFVGPGVCFTNDRWPKSGVTRNLQGVSWRVKRGAAIGANATILPDVTIGRCAVVGAGSLVSSDVPDHALVYGNPARIRGVVCACGQVTHAKDFPMRKKKMVCSHCRHRLSVPKQKDLR